MKKNNLLLTFCIGATVALTYSCKRDIQEDTTPQKAGVPQKVLNSLKEKGSSFTIPINQRTKGFVSDQDGNPLTVFKPKTNARLTTEQEYCDDPLSADPDDVTLVSAEKIYTCGSGYKLTITWQISTVFTLVTANPANSSQLSKGRIKLRNGPTTVYQNTSVTPMTITSLGTDPGNSAKTIYTVSYTTPFISAYTMSQAGWFDNSYVIYTDCGDNITISIPYLSTWGMTVTEITSPCRRIDNIVIVPDGSVKPGYNGYVSGSDVLGSCYDNGYLHNTGTHVQYRLSGTTPWVDLPMYEPDGTPRDDGFIYYWEVLFTQNFTGTYEFRYQNTYTPACTDAPWSSIVTWTY